MESDSKHFPSPLNFHAKQFLVFFVDLEGKQFLKDSSSTGESPLGAT